MAENRDEILANFQACTGIDDVSLAITHLDDTDWDLMRAVNRAIPDESMNRTNDSSPDVEMIQEIFNSNGGARQNNETASDGRVDDSDEDPVVVGATVPFSRAEPVKIHNNWKETSLPSTSLGATTRVIVSCKGQVHSFSMPTSSTVLELKRKIEDVTKVMVCRQAITGWNVQPRLDSVSLSSLSLGPDVTLEVRDTSSDAADDGVVERLTLDFTLRITDENTGKSYSLKYPGSKTVANVKMDIFELCSIPVRNQLWTGWPVSLTSDNVMLALAGLNQPTHFLSVKTKESLAQEKKGKLKKSAADSDDSSVEEFEDATENFNGEEDMFISENNRGKLRPLMPATVDDETVGCLHFADEFANRYGLIHPEFFPGSLDEAIKEACMKPAKERRLLAVYLHHDRSIFSNVFCTQLMCSEAIIQIFAAYFILWGWDLTSVDNQQRFLNSFTAGLGQMAAMQIKSIPVERLPAIIIISRVRSNNEIFCVIQGDVGLDELSAALTGAVDVFTTQQNVEAREEEERSVREMIKQQQDAAFQESLKMDRAKEEARRNQEEAEVKEKLREQQEKEEAAAKNEAERLTAESRLPDEPPADAAAITKIRVRVPKGGMIERRFNETDTLETLFNWLRVQGYRQEEIKLLTSFPRRDLSSFDMSATLKEVSLCPQETVILEER